MSWEHKRQQLKLKESMEPNDHDDFAEKTSHVGCLLFRFAHLIGCGLPLLLLAGVAILLLTG